MNKKVKLIIGIIYLTCFGLLLYGFFTFFDVGQLTSFSYIKENTKILIELKNQNLIIFSVIFFIFSIIWILLLGFASPLALASGFIFGKYFGTLISVISFSIGCTILYMLVYLYFREIVSKYLPKKLDKFKKLFNKNEFFYFLLFRFTGGGGIPFVIQNLMPIIFDMKIKNYFYSTLIGLVPSVFLINALGAGIENIIEKNDDPSFSRMIVEPDIYIPLIGFFVILVISYFIKKFFFK
jgi:uncharacterized membrane protein YdjX (TVP38/TMEM64 family)